MTVTCWDLLAIRRRGVEVCEDLACELCEELVATVEVCRLLCF